MDAVSLDSMRMSLRLDLNVEGGRTAVPNQKAAVMNLACTNPAWAECEGSRQSNDDGRMCDNGRTLCEEYNEC